MAEVVRPLQEVHVHSLAEQAVFECEFSRPLPASALQWRFYPAAPPASASAARSRTQPAPRVLTSDERVSIEQDESGRVARLILREVQLEHQGTFEVTAANATARAALFIDSKLYHTRIMGIIFQYTRIRTSTREFPLNCFFLNTG